MPDPITLDEPNLIARIAAAASGVTVLRPPIEKRTIVIAQGKDFQNGNLEQRDASAPGNNYLNLRVPFVFNVLPELRGPTHLSDGTPVTWTRGMQQASRPPIPVLPVDDTTSFFFNPLQGVLYEIQRVTRKVDLFRALQTEGVHVVYGGHSRHGRGGCEGSADAGPGEEWEEGGFLPLGSPNLYLDAGLMRMGFPYVPVSVHDLHKHAYSALLVTADTNMPATDRHPELVGPLRARTVDEINAECLAWWTAREASGQENHPSAPQLSASQVRNFQLAPTDTRFHFGHMYTERFSEPHVILHAGWQNTTSIPYDIGTIDMRCKAFVCLSCSSKVHFYPIVRHRKQWKKEGDNHYAYWTTAPTHVHNTVFSWVYHNLTYPQPSAFRPWKDVFDYAFEQTNNDQRLCAPDERARLY